MEERIGRRKHTTIKSMLERNSKDFKDNIAIYRKNKKYEYEPITYAELKKDVDAVGEILLKMGLKDKKIAIIGKNSYEWLVSYLATICGVGIVVPLDRQLSDYEIESYMKRIDIELLFYSSEFEERIMKLKDKLSIKKYVRLQGKKMFFKDDTLETLLKKGKALLGKGNRDYEKISIDPCETKSLIFTSGTTSEPKIVMLSHQNIIHTNNSITEHIKVFPEDKFFSVLPFNHVFELSCGILTGLSAGSSIVICDDLHSIGEDMKKTSPSCILVVPKMLDVFLNRIDMALNEMGNTKYLVKALSKITNVTDKLFITKKKTVFKKIHDNFGGRMRFFGVGGAAPNPITAKRLEELGFPVRQGYGLTECGPLVAFNSDNDYDHAAAGKPASCEIKILNPNEKGIGEIIVKGNQVFNGYYEDEESTKKAIDEDGFFHTGDLGFIDSKGFLRVTGRCKNIIVMENGKNISPEEIESKIGSTDIIKEVVVTLGKNEEGKEILIAEIEVEDEILLRMKTNPDEKKKITEIISNYINEANKKLAVYKRIQDFKIRGEAFVRTTTLKVKRYLANEVNEPD